MQTRSRKRKNNEKLETGDEIKLRSQLESNVPIMRSGKINKIILKNFMAHSDLIVDFNKNVNVFIGSFNNSLSPQNTVLKALLFALGSSVDKDRCIETVNLVKKGKTTGSVEIYIANDSGYDTETFGNQIIVKRTFSLNGTSLYFIQNESGKVVSTSREKLMEILNSNFLNIQVDNPICVLDLESSTEYLKKSDPKKLFQFFVKATQINDLMEKLIWYRTQYSVTEKHLDEQHKLMDAVTKEKQDIEAKLHSLQSMDCKINPLKETLHKLVLELDWLKVQNEESLLQDIRDALNKHKKMHDDISQSIIQNKNNIDNHRAKCTLLSQEIEHLKIIKKKWLGQKSVINRCLLKDFDDFKNVGKKVEEMAMEMEHNTKNFCQLKNDMSKSSVGPTININQRLQYLHERKTSIKCVRDTVSLDTEMLNEAKRTSETKITHFRHQRAINLEKKRTLSEYIRQWKPRIESNAVFLHVNERKECLIEQLREVEDWLHEIDLKISAEKGKQNDLSRQISEKARILEKIDEDILNITEEIQKSGNSPKDKKQLQKAVSEELNRLEKELLPVKDSANKIASSIEKKKNAMKKIDEKLRAVTAQIYEKHAKFDSEKSLHKTESETAKVQKQKDDLYMSYIKKLEKDQKNCIKKISDLKLTASMQGERVEPSYSYDILSAKIEETKQMLININNGSDSLKNLQQKLQKKNVEYGNSEECVKKIEKSLEELRLQSQELMTLRRDVSLRTQDEFKKIMKSLNFDGSITIDFREQSLELSVIPTSKDIAIVGFLFSLWSMADLPFYFLDEGGVYTDAVNRAHITKLLLDEGTKNLHRQYTFITTQFLAEVANSNHISIHRLPDPTSTKPRLTHPRLTKPRLVDPRLTKQILTRKLTTPRLADQI